MKKILVSGGAGFLGSHLCDQLVAEGNLVTCLDNFFSGSKQNINHLLSQSNFEFLQNVLVLPYSKTCSYKAEQKYIKTSPFSW